MRGVETTDTDAATGGDDIIDAGDGANYVLGGNAADTITTGSGVDFVLGDNGSVTYEAMGGVFTLTEVKTTDTDAATGGNDVINAGAGANHVLGGIGADTITTGFGNDFILGDNGLVDYDNTTGDLLLVSSTDTDPANIIGGDDTISAGDGNNYVIGGTGIDNITTGSHTDFVLGDNGDVAYQDMGGTFKLTEVRTTDTDATTGGDDIIDAGESSNHVLGGVGNDDITTSGDIGNDFILGDNGLVDYDDTTGNLALVSSSDTDPTNIIGGDDIIRAGDGANYVIGGNGIDNITRYHRCG